MIQTNDNEPRKAYFTGILINVQDKPFIDID